MRSFTMALIGLAAALPAGAATVPAHADSGGFFDNAQHFFNNWGDHNEPYRYEHHRREENAQHYGWNEHNRHGENGRAYPGNNHEHEHWHNGEQQSGYRGDHDWNAHRRWEHHYGSGPETRYGYNGENNGYERSGYGVNRRDSR